MNGNENSFFDLVLRGGRVIDPVNGIVETMDVAIRDHKICAVGKNLPCENAGKTIDVNGCVVTPGLIDMHSHILQSLPLSADGLAAIDPDAHMFQSGVTTAVDAGTSGSRDFLRLKEDIIDHSQVRILAFVNIASGGMVNMASEQETGCFHPKIVAAIAESFPDVVVGVKTAHYWVGKPFDEAHPAWASVDSALRAGELCARPVMVDFQPTLPGRSYPDLLNRLRPGDIHTHMYAQQFPVLDENGAVCKELFQARERGVLFDLGHGTGSFWFRNAVPACRQGFSPDTLSTDLYMNNSAGPVINLLHVMSKFLNIGMPLDEVIGCVTQRPARNLHHDELGTLSIGACADVAVLRQINVPCGFADSGNARLNGSTKLECMMTIRNGKIVFDPNAMSMPEWESAPPSYWTAPGIIR
ncbi:MAG: hypothetical protein ACERKO_00225 [Acetanaerobacterium sp.]